ncbi:MAG: nucleotidyltransferase family protein [Acidobacteria bacterium]|nr:nucleotidyltransferase family protein [Acidobacteriota bacterium]MCX6597006.1 nucleotidyltransferase family protein [Acidobacteriota bacterium]
MTIATGIEIPLEQLHQICQRYQIHELSLFGSAARGEMRADSDIDLLVEFAPDTHLGWRFFDLEIELADLFGRKVDLGTKASLKPRVRANVLRDARVIYAA